MAGASKKTLKTLMPGGRPAGACAAADQQERDRVGVFDRERARTSPVSRADSHRADQRLSRPQIQLEMAGSVFEGHETRSSLSAWLHGDAAVGAIRGEIDGRLLGRQPTGQADRRRTGEPGRRQPEFGPCAWSFRLSLLSWASPLASSAQ